MRKRAERSDIAATLASGEQSLNTDRIDQTVLDRVTYRSCEGVGEEVTACQLDSGPRPPYNGIARSETRRRQWTFNPNFRFPTP